MALNVSNVLEYYKEFHDTVTKYEIRLMLTTLCTIPPPLKEDERINQVERLGLGLGLSPPCTQAHKSGV